MTEEKKTAFIGFRVASDAVTKLRKAADNMKKSISQYVRDAAIEKAEEEET